MKANKNLKIIISGGGTGGHIFPALSIADEIKRREPGAEILFVGADNRMEMERVPAAGYKIVGLPVQGLKRALTLKNIKVVFDFLKSRRMAKSIIKDFKPHVAIGVGGYASAPVLKAASGMHIPCLLQEQNSYAGVTNKLLSKKADTICVAYENMGKYFPNEKIINLGNPVRNIQISTVLKKEAREHFHIKTDNPVLFIMGGSLGARTLNNAMVKSLEMLADKNIEVLWQTGKYYYNTLQKELEGKLPGNIQMLDFVTRMDLAYNVSDLLISRAGALSLSEICLVGKPSVLVPSPNVAEDHQTKNAMALVEQEAARMVKDMDAEEKLIPEALSLIQDGASLVKLADNAKKLAKPNATKDIVDQVFKLLAKAIN